jgi:predicted ABC-type ATPase
MLRRLRQLARDGEDFGFESTLSSRTFAPFLRDLKERGYRVSLFYFSLKSASLAVRRVKMRVRLGGHDVPADIVKRRFARSIANFFWLYQPLLDEWTLFDNSTDEEAHLVASHNAALLTVKDERAWPRIQRLANVSISPC